MAVKILPLFRGYISIEVKNETKDTVQSFKNDNPAEEAPILRIAILF
ncbi:hypothetical protein PGS_00008550 [Porphyromonas gingivalis A7A1-28]|nr:hypothetical protein PGS_00008550 [Porphyromonas gingivalis A7A1-28]